MVVISGMVAFAQDFTLSLKKTDSIVYTNVFFASENTGYASGFRFNGAVGKEKGVVYKTINGGVSWTLIDTNQFPVTPAYFKTIFFLDENNGYVGGYTNQLYKTTDGGSTWQNLSNNLAFTPVFNNAEIRAIYFKNSNEGVVMSGNGEICRTDNGGQTWSKTYAPLGSSRIELKSLQFINNTNGFVWGQNTIGNFESIILKTNDSGLTWDTLWFGNSSNNKRPYFFGDSTLYAINNSGLIKSLDGGKTNTLLSAQYNTLSIIQHQFMDAQKGIIYNDRKIYRTLDSGATITEVKIDTNGVIKKPVFLNNQITRGLIIDGNIVLFNGFSIPSGMKEIATVDVNVFPNPVTDKILNINSLNDLIIDLYLTDINGKGTQLKVQQGATLQQVNLNNYPGGIYFLHITTAYKTKIVKIVVQ